MIPLPPQIQKDEGKLTVVLDLDETLIHAEVFPLNDLKQIEISSNFSPPSLNPFYLTFPQKNLAVKIIKRPFLDEFLALAAQRFELIIFTAGHEEYASAVLDHLDPSKTVFRHSLFRQHCSGKKMSKDLEIVNRALNRTVLVDNNPLSFLDSQLENGVPISSFINDPCDFALIHLSQLLGFLSGENDVRSWLSSIFELRKNTFEENIPQ